MLLFLTSYIIFVIVIISVDSTYRQESTHREESTSPEKVPHHDVTKTDRVYVTRSLNKVTDHETTKSTERLHISNDEYHQDYTDPIINDPTVTGQDYIADTYNITITIGKVS